MGKQEGCRTLTKPEFVCAHAELIIRAAARLKSSEVLVAEEAIFITRLLNAAVARSAAKVTLKRWSDMAPSMNFILRPQYTAAFCQANNHIRKDYPLQLNCIAARNLSKIRNPASGSMSGSHVAHPTLIYLYQVPRWILRCNLSIR